MAPRELDLAVVACACLEQVVALEFPVARCHVCGLTPHFVRSTVWWLGVDFEI